MIPFYVTAEYLQSLTLISGVGNGTAGQRCAMQEVRAWLDLDAASDEVPACVCPVIGKMIIGLNDAAPATRVALLFRLPAIIGTRGRPALSRARAYLARDWLIRVYTPAWLDRVPSLVPHAAAIRALGEIVDRESAVMAGPVMRAARDAARDAWDAIPSLRAASSAVPRSASAAPAARDAASAAASASTATTAAARAAGAAARDAAWDVARAIAVAAAGDAASRHTVETLQASALDLLDRMLACGEHRREEKE